MGNVTCPYYTPLNHTFYFCCTNTKINFLSLSVDKKIEGMDLKFNQNEDRNKLLLSDLRRKLTEVSLGGGKAKIAKQHDQGKMTARERIDYLLDTNSERIEVGAFVGDGMYEEHGGCPSGGVVIKIGYVQGKQC